MEVVDPTVESDTEYPAVDLDDCPKTIFIESSGNRKFDGSYERLPKASRGRPGYVKRGEKKPLYLFWNKKWSIGWEFGSHKCAASVKDVPGVLSPCEPYPFCWKVQVKKDHSKGDEPKKEKEPKEKVLSMRVIDGDVLHISRDTQELVGGTPDEGADRRASSSRKRRLSVPVGEDAAARPEVRKRQAKTDANGSPVKREPGVAIDEDAEAIQAAAGSDDDDDDEGSESSQSDSDSSDDSSSESASGKGAAAKEVVKLEPLPPSSPADSASADVSSKRVKFEAQVRKQLEALAAQGKEAQTKRVMRIREMSQTSNKVQEAYGMEHQAVEALLETISRELDIPAQLPPPRPFIKKKEELGAAAAAPVTPPRETDAEEQPWKTMKPEKGVLRPYGVRQRRLPGQRLGLREPDFERKAFVQSFRAEGDMLWYNCPGATVHCDHCDKKVPQALGSLQGAPGQSQFAQNKFLCVDCNGF